MPINATYEFAEAQKRYDEAKTPDEKLKALKVMLSAAPTHKGAEKLRSEIKQKIARFRDLAAKAKKSGGSRYQAIRKDGAARITIVGVPNSGKSTLLMELTGANPKIAEYPYTTREPEVGTLDYKGVKLQLIEIPAVDEGYVEKERGLFFLSIAKTSDLILGLANSEKEKRVIRAELERGECTARIVWCKRGEPKNMVKELVWKSLGLIKVYTKMPGKEKEDLPVALPLGSTLKDLARRIHKDFVKKFRFARVWGKSAKFDGQNISNLNYVLADDDVVELHER